MAHHLFLIETPDGTRPGLTMKGAWTTYFGLRARKVAVRIVSVNLDNDQRTVLAEFRAPRCPKSQPTIERLPAL